MPLPSFMAAALAGCHPPCLLQAGRGNLAAETAAFRRLRIHLSSGAFKLLHKGRQCLYRVQWGGIVDRCPASSHGAVPF